MHRGYLLRVVEAENGNNFNNCSLPLRTRHATLPPVVSDKKSMDTLYSDGIHGVVRN